ncbi:MAG: hypothetical protein N3B13_00340 [Deltaproteobacteria bacterium]|nr:hypothetical protein [Deltaproteobacteria bacterium]
MQRVKTNVVFSTFTAVVFILIQSVCCSEKISQNGEIEAKNRIELTGVRMKEYGKNSDIMLKADYFILDRDSADVSFSEGLFIADIKSHKLSDRLEILFKNGKYNLKSKKFNLSIREGLLKDSNIRLLTGGIEYNMSDGHIRSYEGVRLVGNNFEFEGNKFSGNIREGIFIFEEGITARLFR